MNNKDIQESTRTNKIYYKMNNLNMKWFRITTMKKADVRKKYKGHPHPHPR